jgi:hypothetical protein
MAAEISCVAANQRIWILASSGACKRNMRGYARQLSSGLRLGMETSLPDVHVLPAGRCSFSSSDGVASRSLCAGRPRLGMRVTVAGRPRGTGSSFDARLPAVMETTLRWWNMPDRRLMCGAEVQSDSWGFRARISLFHAAQVDLQLVGSGVMDVIGTAARLDRKRA